MAKNRLKKCQKKIVKKKCLKNHQKKSSKNVKNNTTLCTLAGRGENGLFVLFFCFAAHARISYYLYIFFYFCTGWENNEFFGGFTVCFNRH